MGKRGAESPYVGSRVRVIDKKHPCHGKEGKCVDARGSWLTVKLVGLGEVHVRSGSNNVLRLSPGRALPRKGGRKGRAVRQVVAKRQRAMRRPRKQSAGLFGGVDATAKIEDDPLQVPTADTVQQCYSVGERVVYTPALGKPRLGTVAYVGALQCQPYIGLELDVAAPDQHDGLHSASGERHFHCVSGHGLYVSASSARLRKVDAAALNLNRAAEKLKKLRSGLETVEEQATLRTARLQRQAEATLQASGDNVPCYRKRWDALAQRYMFFLKGKSLRCGQSSAPPGALIASVEGGPDAHERQSTGKLPQLASLERGYMSLEEAHAVYMHCTTRWAELLSADLLLALARAGRDRFLQEASVLRLSVPPGGRLLVFGDTHAQLKDVVHVWRQEGPPALQRIYLFNGDICDRGDSARRGGQQALHIWAMMLSFKLACPGSVFMTRGNHEDASYWPDYEEDGFRGEIYSKYKCEDADQLNQVFGDLCESLPLAACIDDRCLVVHGGLSRFWEGRAAANLEEMDRVRRPLPMPDGPGGDREATILYDITWSDPQAERGIGMNDRGGGCISYGPDVTRAFLFSEGLGLLVRSHEVPGRGRTAFEDRGFEWWHPIDGEVSGTRQPRPLSASQEGWCLTIFTASDYCGYHDSNNGAFLAFNGSVLDFRIVEHSGLEAERSLLGEQRDLVRSPLAKAEDQSLTQGRFDRALVELIVKHKHELLKEFLVADAVRDFFLPVRQWLECCHRVLPSIPWEHYAGDPYIAPITSCRVSYLSFLTRYQVRFRNKLGRHAGFRRQLTDRLFEGLMSADRTLRETLDLLDFDRDGRVSVEDFARALSAFGIVLAEGQVAMLYRTTIACQDRLHPEDVLGALSVRFCLQNARHTTEADQGAPRQLESACRELLELGGGPRTGKSLPQVLREFFEQADKNRNGFLELSELLVAFRALRSCRGLDDSQLQAMASFIDVTGDGRVNYPELLAAFCVRQPKVAGPAGAAPGPVGLLEDVLEAIYRTLHFEYARPLRVLLRHQLPAGSRHCTPAMFERSLLALAHATPAGQVSQQQVRLLVDSLDVELGAEGSCFDFVDFFDSFSIVDTVAGEDSSG